MLRKSFDYLRSAFGVGVAYLICGVPPFIVYIGAYRMLTEIGGFSVDPMLFGIAVIIIHFGWMTYNMIRTIEEAE